MLAQEWSSRAIHDTVAAIVRDRAYHRSIVGSLVGRAVAASLDAIGRMIRALQKIPGGRTTVIAAVVVIAALVVARILLTAEWRKDDFAHRRGNARRPVRQDLWSEAERLAAEGDHTGAAHSLYQAVLRRLAGSERIRLHPSKTSGDYSRELRRRGSPAAAAFQQFGRRFDRVIFGVGECSPDEFRAMVRDASAISHQERVA